MRMTIIYSVMQIHVIHRLSPVLPSHAFQVKAVSALQEAARGCPKQKGIIL